MKAHDILSDESKWTKGTLARNRLGEPCDYVSQSACKWCVEGALHAAYPSLVDDYTAAFRLEDETGRKIHKWHDDPETTFQDVRKLLLKLDV